jgi:hypothetical protein
MGVEAILAGQAGGGSDEFDYPVSNTLPSPMYRRINTAINDQYGTDGKGSAIGYPIDALTGPVLYCRAGTPFTTANMQITAYLSRTPWWDLFVKSSWFLLVQASATGGNKSFIGVEIMNNKCQFFQWSTTGVKTALSQEITIPANAVGVPYTLAFKDGTLTLTVNGIAVANAYGITPLSGRCVGFGGNKVAYTHLTDNPLAHFAGIAWQEPK